MANTGDIGGQCVAYAKKTIKPASGITGNANTWYTNSTYCTPVAIKSKCVACWSGGPGGYGHVGVVETWNSSTSKMKYSDSNYKLDEKVIVRDGITVDQMKALFGSSFTFQGYVTLK